MLRPKLAQTCCFKSQVSADHLSINSIPEVITHCAPLIAIADLHTSTSGIASLKSDGSLGASGAPHSSIFNMCATMHSKSSMGAVCESGLSSATLDVRQPDLSSTIGEAKSQGHSTCMGRYVSQPILNLEDRDEKSKLQRYAFHSVRYTHNYGNPQLGGHNHTTILATPLPRQRSEPLFALLCQRRRPLSQSYDILLE